MRNKIARSKLVQELKQQGVESVTAAYDGSGDNGQIDDPEFGGVEVSDDLDIHVQDLFYDLLEAVDVGWQDNEGSFGQFMWNVQEDRITLRHTTRTEDTVEHDL